MVVGGMTVFAPVFGECLKVPSCWAPRFLVLWLDGVGFGGLFFVFTMLVSGLLASSAPSGESLRQKVNPGDSPPFIPCVSGYPASLPPPLRLSGPHIYFVRNVQCFWLYLVGGTGKNMSTPSSQKQNGFSLFAGSY